MGHVGLGEDRRAAAQDHHLRVGDPVGAGDHHLVAGVQGGEQRVVDDVLAAGADDGLRDLVVEPVLALELLDDRFAQRVDAGDRRVLGLAAADRIDRRLLDVVGRVEIRLADREADDIDARGFQLARLLGHRDGRGRLHPREGVGEKAHGRSPKGLRVCGGPKDLPGIAALVIMRRGTSKRGRREAAAQPFRSEAASSQPRPVRGRLQFFSIWNEVFLRRTLGGFSGIVTDKTCSFLQCDSISVHCNDNCMQNSAAPVRPGLVRTRGDGRQ